MNKAALRACSNVYVTNLLLQSESLSNATWTAIGAKEVASGATDPLGGTTAWTLSDTSAAAFNGIAQSVTVANKPDRFRLSCFVKKTSGGTAPAFGFNLTIATVGQSEGRWNTDTGATGTSFSPGLAAFGGDWWYFYVDFTNTSGTGLSVSFFSAVGPAHAAPSTANQNATATGSAIIWRPMLQRNTSIITSMLPTTTVARSGLF